jgi:hypothetical protein
MRPAEHATAIQRQTNGTAFQLAPTLSSFGYGIGQRLPDPVREKMESVFDASFSDVRIHLGPQAGSIGALAFTHGSNIYFAPGQYNPHTAQGQQLLGHELAHVVQQRSGRVANPFGAGIAVIRDPALEAEADQMGMRAAHAAMPVQAKPPGAGLRTPLPSSAPGAKPFARTGPSLGGLALRPKARAILSSQRSAQPKLVRFSGLPRIRAAGPSSRTGAVVQRRMNLTPSDFPINSVARRLARLAKRLQWPRILGDDVDQEQRIIASNLDAMIEGLENYGAFDVEDEQQLGLLYFQVLSYIKHVTLGPPGTHERLQKALAAPKTPPAIYDLAFIGAGTTTAYYIDTLGPWHDHSTTLLFGDTKKNPWAGQRGFSIDFINHARRQIDFPSKNITDYPLEGDEKRSTGMFMKRRRFARHAAAIIAAAIPESQCIKDEIERGGISKPDANYQIKTKGGAVYRVKKIVFAAGAGGHKAPAYKEGTGKAYEMDVPSTLRGTQVIDMDRFIRDVVQTDQPGRVIVVGPNAAIDAVAAAKLCKWEVVWFAGAPAFLPGTFYMDKPYELQKVERFDAVHVDVVPAGKKMDVYFCNQVKSGLDKHERSTVCARTISEKQCIKGVDFIVYGIGPLGTLGSLLAKELIEELEPVYEETFKFAPGKYEILPSDLSEYVNKRLAKIIPENSTKEAELVAWAQKQKESRGAGKAFLGLKTKDSGLLVFGAAAEAHAPTRTMVGSDPGSVRAAVSSDVLTHGQLTYIRAAIVAHNQFIPASVGQRVDFGHANADILRAHLAAKYPDIGNAKVDLDDTVATRIIEVVMTLARDRRIPHGYTRDQEQLITRALEEIDRAFGSGSGLTQLQARVTRLGNDLIKSIAKANVNPTYLQWLKTNPTELEAFNKEQEQKRALLKLDQEGFFLED